MIRMEYLFINLMEIKFFTETQMEMEDGPITGMFIMIVNQLIRKLKITLKIITVN